MIEHSTDETDGSIDLFFQIAVRQMLAGHSFEEVLDWSKMALPKLVPEWAEQFGNAEEPLRAFCLHLVRYLWTHMPDPELDFRTRQLDKPQRNRPCPCGSGRKYKQCCQFLEEMTRQFPRISLLPYVLELIPRKRFRDLSVSRLNPEEIAQVAYEWYEADRLEDAEALLEAFFKQADKLDHRAEPAFDLLMDVYLALYRPRKRQRLLKQVLASSDRQLRVAAMHRQCVMLSDEGDFESAWDVFREAQRLDPDNPNLSHLEIVLLIADGRQDEAAERARFWIARLKRANAEEYAELIALLEQFAKDPVSATLGLSDDGEAVERLESLLARHPETQCHYSLDPVDGDAGPLRAKSELAELEARWSGLLSDNPFDVEIAKLIDWLAAHPKALDSFAVLQGIVLQLDELDLPVPLDRIRRSLLERAETLLHQVISANRAEDCQLAWGWLENRPALWLVGELATVLIEDDPKRAAELMEWLVMTLNPNDNQGLRGPLAHLYVQLAEPEKAVALTDRYPDDFADMQYARALALYATGEKGRALQALDDARRRFPKVLKTLVAKNPKMPANLNPYGITMGGEDEAWIYRMSYRRIWESANALDWAEKVAGSKK